MKKNVSIFDYRTGTEYLSAVYKAIVEKNSRYSLRSFSQKIGVDQSTLVRYMAKERFISGEKCQVIAEKLNLNQIETYYFQLLTSFGDRNELEILEKLRTGFLFHECIENSLAPETNPLLGKEHTLDIRAHLVYEMQNLAKDFSIGETVQILNRFFKADETEVLEIMNTLIQQGFLEESTGKQRQQIIKKIFLAPAKVPREAGLRYHRTSLDAAKTALNDFENSDVEIYTTTIAVKSEAREKILQAVQQLHGVISEYMAEENADDIFLVTSYMVNLTGSKTKQPTK